MVYKVDSMCLQKFLMIRCDDNPASISKRLEFRQPWLLAALNHIHHRELKAL